MPVAKVLLRDSHSEWTEKIEVSSCKTAAEEVVRIINKFNADRGKGVLPRQFVKLLGAESSAPPIEQPKPSRAKRIRKERWDEGSGR